MVFFDDKTTSFGFALPHLGFSSRLVFVARYLDKEFTSVDVSMLHHNSVVVQGPFGLEAMGDFQHKPVITCCWCENLRNIAV